MAKRKYYAVAAGRREGVFTDWATTEKQVKGFAGAKYKSFASEEEARAWLNNPVYEKKVSKTKAQDDLTAKVDPDDIVIYTDGGSINNPGPGGYGIVIEKNGDRVELSGGFRLTTNNRMEMFAAIKGLESLGPTSRKIHLFSDSSYMVNGVEKGWAKSWRARGWKKSGGEPALNSDLWQRLLELIENVDVSFHWVKGHAGNELNERCDSLAVAAARSTPDDIDTVYETVTPSVL